MNDGVQTNRQQPTIPVAPPQPYGTPPQPQSNPQPQPGRQPPRSGAQILLLTTGVALIAIALITFASIGYTTFGEVRRIIGIGVLGATALVMSLLLADRFRISAEGVAWAGLIALSVDAWLVGDLPVFAGDRMGLGAAATGGFLLAGSAISLAASLMHGKTARPLRAFGLYAIVASLFGIMLLMSMPAMPRALGDGIVVAAAAAAVAITVLVRKTPSADVNASVPTTTGLRSQRPTSPAAYTPQQNVAFQHSASQSNVMNQPQPAFERQPELRPAAQFQTTPQPQSQPTPMSPSQSIPPFQQASQPTAPTQPITPPITPRLPAPTHGAERVIAATIGSFMLMLITLGDYRLNQPGTDLVAVAAYVLLLSLVGAIWARAATIQPKTPDGLLLPAPIPAMSMEAIRWIVSLAAAVAYIGLAVVINDADGLLHTDGATLLAAVATLATGIYWMHRRPCLRSWTALWPGLILLFASTYVTAMAHFDVMWRFVALLVASTACMLAGALLRWQAPLVMGSVMLVIVAASRLWPWIAAFSRDFWWVWLLACGIILVVAAIRYEASMASMRAFCRRIGDMR